MRIVPTVKAKCINKGSLCIQVTLPGSKEKRLFKNLLEKIDPKYWVDDKVSSKHPDSFRLNKILSDEVTRLQTAFEQDRKDKIAFTEAHVLQRMAGVETNPKDFYAFSTEQIASRNYRETTRKNYRGEISKMKKYAPSLLFSDINYKWLQGYESYMRSAKIGNADNTVWKSLKFINTMITQAIKTGGIITKNPFKEYSRGKYKQGIPVYLEWPEIQQLHKAIIEKQMPDIVRLTGYYSLLSYYSGLRYGDAISFDYKKKVIEDSKGKRLILKTEKTGEIVSIPFTKYIAEVVEYIRDRPIKITNQEFNSNIKFIAGLADIRKDISSHTARHSFAMRCAELLMSMDDVQKLLGHEQKKSTAIYFRIKDKRLDAAMKKWE